MVGLMGFGGSCWLWCGGVDCGCERERESEWVRERDGREERDRLVSIILLGCM